MAKFKKFDMDKTGEMTDFSEPLPVGEYLVEITGTELKDTKAGDSQYVNFEFTILKGDFKGRKVWKILNLFNKNVVAVEMAEKELATIHRALGLDEIVGDSKKLHNKPLIVKLGIEVDDYGKKNKIKLYKPAGEKAAKDKPSKNTSPWEEEGEEEVKKDKKDKKSKKDKKDKKGE